MDIYGHVMPAAQQDAAGLMDAALGGVGAVEDREDDAGRDHKLRRSLLSPLLSGGVVALPEEEDQSQKPWSEGRARRDSNPQPSDP
jgi:hypothetical protein